MSVSFNIETIRNIFDIKGEFVEYKQNTNGHVNSTFILKFKENEEIKKYVLQMISTDIFKNPEGLMSNIVGVTNHIRKKLKTVKDEFYRRNLLILETYIHIRQDILSII